MLEYRLKMHKKQLNYASLKKDIKAMHTFYMLIENNIEKHTIEGLTQEETLTGLKTLLYNRAFSLIFSYKKRNIITSPQQKDLYAYIKEVFNGFYSKILTENRQKFKKFMKFDKTEGYSVHHNEKNIEPIETEPEPTEPTTQTPTNTHKCTCGEELEQIKDTELYLCNSCKKLYILQLKEIQYKPMETTKNEY